MRVLTMQYASSEAMRGGGVLTVLVELAEADSGRDHDRFGGAYYPRLLIEQVRSLVEDKLQSLPDSGTTFKWEWTSLRIEDDIAIHEVINKACHAATARTVQVTFRVPRVWV